MPKGYLRAHRRHLARLREKWADELGDPDGSLLSEGNYAILAEYTEEQRAKDLAMIEA